jgi:hypothetical protein
MDENDIGRIAICYLLNFGEAVMKNDITRTVNGLEEV